MSSLKLELGYPACSHLCQHPSSWPSPSPRNRGLQNPRFKRLLEAQTQLSELSETDVSASKQSEQTLPTLKILDIGECTAVDPVKPPSSPNFFPAVPCPRKTTRTVSYNRRTRSRTHELPPSTASISTRRSPISRADEKRTSPKHLPIKLNYVTVHDTSHPVTSPPANKHPTWVPTSTPTAVSYTTAPLHISPLKNVTSQLIGRNFEDEGAVISSYPRGPPGPAPQPAWDAWEETAFSLARAQLAAFPITDESDPDKTLLSSRSDISYLSNRDLFLSGRGLWRPIRSNKRHLPSSRQQSRSLPSRAFVPAKTSHPPQLRQVSISLDSIPHIPKRVPVVLERFLSHQPSNSKQKCEKYEIEENNIINNNNTQILAPTAPPPTPNCSQNLSGSRATLHFHLPASPPSHQTEP